MSQVDQQLENAQKNYERAERDYKLALSNMGHWWQEIVRLTNLVIKQQEKTDG